jgi:hypothetical protein
MVQREELQQLLRQRPFRPFRVYVTDGRVFDIRFHDMNLLRESYFDIGIPEENGGPDPFADHFVMVPIKMIARVELMEVPSSPLS